MFACYKKPFMYILTSCVKRCFWRSEYQNAKYMVEKTALCVDDNAVILIKLNLNIMKFYQHPVFGALCAISKERFPELSLFISVNEVSYNTRHG